MGLLLGAFMAPVIATIYFVFGYPFPPLAGSIGLVLVVLGLLYLPLVSTGVPLLRSGLNTVFVMGFALVLIGVDKVGGFKFDLIAIGLFVFWMFTRIQLSRWDHGRICRSCGYRCDEDG